jgi:hypothetical protein
MDFYRLPVETAVRTHSQTTVARHKQETAA